MHRDCEEWIEYQIKMMEFETEFDCCVPRQSLSPRCLIEDETTYAGRTTPTPPTRKAYEINGAVYGSTSPRLFVSWYKAAWWEGGVEIARQTAEVLYREMKLASHRAGMLNLLANIYATLER